MERPTINTEGIAEQQRIATLAWIPTVANGTWSRPTAAGETNALGEPVEAAEASTWPVCVFEAQGRRGRYRWQADGTRVDAEQRLLVALPEGSEVEGEFEPAAGDQVTVGGVARKAVGVEVQPNPVRVFWMVTGTRMD